MHTNRHRDWVFPILTSFQNNIVISFSGGLNLVESPYRRGIYLEWIEQCLPNRYAVQKLWLADDLAASISARTVTEHEPDNGKLVLSVGVIDIHCTVNFPHVNCHLTFVQVLAVRTTHGPNCLITRVWPLSSGPDRQADRLIPRLCGTCGEPLNTGLTSGQPSH